MKDLKHFLHLRIGLNRRVFYRKLSNCYFIFKTLMVTDCISEQCQDILINASLYWQKVEQCQNCSIWSLRIATIYPIFSSGLEFYQASPGPEFIANRAFRQQNRNQNFYCWHVRMTIMHQTYQPSHPPNHLGAEMSWCQSVLIPKSPWELEVWCRIVFVPKRLGPKRLGAETTWSIRGSVYSPIAIRKWILKRHLSLDSTCQFCQ